MRFMNVFILPIELKLSLDSVDKKQEKIRGNISSSYSKISNKTEIADEIALIATANDCWSQFQ